MKKRIISGTTLLVLLVAAVLLLHPVKVLSGTSYRYQVFITGTIIPVEGFSPMSGGVRAYLDEENYIWFSSGTYLEDAEAAPFGIRWDFFWKEPVLQYGRE